MTKVMRIDEYASKRYSQGNCAHSVYAPDDTEYSMQMNGLTNIVADYLKGVCNQNQIDGIVNDVLSFRFQNEDMYAKLPEKEKFHNIKTVLAGLGVEQLITNDIDGLTNEIVDFFEMV